MPRRAASAADISTVAAAPSEIEDEDAAVTVPSLRNAGFSVAIFARSTVNGVSSRSTTVSPLRPLTVTGVISAANAPELTACSARCVDSVANASCSARVKPYFCAVSSANAPMSWPSNGLCRPS